MAHIVLKDEEKLAFRRKQGKIHPMKDDWDMNNDIN